eukprot:scaffold5417_cov129-Isochrysis_galbana.AAC.3
MRSRAMACIIRADPNMEPRAVDRQAVATPSTTNMGLTHRCCIADRSNCRAPRSTVPAWGRGAGRDTLASAGRAEGTAHLLHNHGAADLAADPRAPRGIDPLLHGPSQRLGAWRSVCAAGAAVRAPGQE